MNVRNNRTLQLIVQSAYCALGILGAVASTGFFDYNYKESFFVYFTNISNYICVAVMLFELIQTARKKEDSPVSAIPLVKFAGIMGILLTFLIYNFILAHQAGRDPASNFTVLSILYHVVLPVVYIADWFIFYERKHTKWFFPVVGMIYPAIYLVFVYVRAWIFNFDPSTPLLYPYFFLDPVKQGATGLMLWFFILSLYFTLVGFGLFAIDVAAQRINKRKRSAEHPTQQV